MSKSISEKIVIKTTDPTSADVPDSIYDALVKERFVEDINLAIEGNTIEFEICEDVNISFDIKDLLEKIHKCNANIQTVCSIDLDSNIGYYTVTSSSDSPASVVYDIFSEFVGDVLLNLNYSLKDAALGLFHDLEKK